VKTACDYNKNKKMKISTIVLLFSVLVTVSAQAQHVNVGLKAGLNLYNVNNSNAVDYNMKPGLYAGLLGHIHVSKQFAIQPELLYSAQGVSYTVSGTQTKLKLGYINVPVMLQYMFDNGFRLQAGPQVGFLVNAKSETGGSNTDIKSNYKAVDFAVGAGVGYIHVPSGFGVDARYNLGLSDINDNSTVKSTNRGFQLGVFYQFKHH
jgi:hypothetical protein